MITKQAALAKLDAADDAAAKALLARVGGVLSKYDGRTITVDVDKAPPKAIGSVVAHARAAGWTVNERWGDQRDPGHWLEFS